MGFGLTEITNKSLTTNQLGSFASEGFSGSSNFIKTFKQPMNGFVVSNDGTTDLIFAIGTDVYTVRAGEVFSSKFNAFTQVSIITTSAYRAYGLCNNTPIAPVPVFSDSFIRSDNPNSLGSPWVANVDTFGIIGNQAYIPTHATNDPNAIVDFGVSDCAVSVTFPVISYNPRLIFRYVDVSNFWTLETVTYSTPQVYRVYKKVANAFTKVGNDYSTPTNGDTPKFILKGGQIQFYLNNVLQDVFTDSFNQSSTKHGIGAGGTSSNTIELNRYSNFNITT